NNNNNNNNTSNNNETEESSVFYFASHHCLMENMKEQLNIHSFDHVQGDTTVSDWLAIDWWYIIFLRLGLIPSTFYSFFCFYFHQRLHGQLDQYALLQLSS
ncbi:hypothetical protein RFI_26701, partial [Reticulomyxa filosa]